jgi:ADP-heptose:LPS heptosyltransferase
MKPLLKNGLFVRRPLSNALLRLMSWARKSRRSDRAIPDNPKKILLSNIANFGDVVISTAVLPVIKKKFPHSEIGFITSSASAVVLQDHPLVNRIHRFDHGYLHRRAGVCKAALQHLRTRRTLLQELREARYDLAIDLYSYFPNTIPLLARSSIPVLVGYGTGGFERALTHPVKWDFQDRYVGYAHLQLLKILGVESEGESPLPSYNYKKKGGNYIAVHMGSADESKEWDVEKWIEFIRRLEAKGEKIVLTGKGKREGELCSYVAKATQAKDLSNKLSWIEFVTIVQEAKTLISVDSVAVHIAAGSSTLTIGLFSGINEPRMWMPPSSFYRGVMMGKEGRSSTIEVEDVYALLNDERKLR